jgi:hypothetical protein
MVLASADEVIDENARCSYAKATLDKINDGHFS